MKKLYFLLFAILFSLLLNAQPYIPFPTSYSQWNQVETWRDGGSSGTLNSFNYQYLLNGDTVIDNINYHKVFQIRFDIKEFVGGLREDSIKNIFFYPANEIFYLVDFPSDTTEYLLYSFNNLNIGTVVTINNNNIYVLGIDSVLLGSTYHKRYMFNNSEYWIEGIGSNVELFSNYIRSLSSSFYTLCFKPDSVNTYYINSPDNENWCYYYVGTHNIKSENLSIYPNPVIDNLTITGEFSPKATFYITDVSGNILLRDFYRNSIYIPFLSPGMYAITIVDEKTSYTAKFIKH